MFTEQAQDASTLSFLEADSEMATMIRRKDWGDHPLGPPEEWPAPLRSALGIALNSTFPTAIYWGNELRLLYNDAWSAIPGPRHPASLGKPAVEVWPDIWDVIAPQFRQVVETGRGLTLEDQFLPMERYGVPEHTYWNYSFSPIRRDDGRIVGIFNTGQETTGRVLSAKKTELLVDLDDTLRTLTNTDDIRRTAVSFLGERMEVDRVGITAPLLGDDETRIEVIEQWTGNDIAPVDSIIELKGSRQEFVRRTTARDIVRIENIDHHDDRVLKDRFAELCIKAALVVPWIENEQPTGMFYLHSAQPREWNEYDVAMVVETVERAAIWIEKLEIAAREKMMIREVDHRAKNALAIAQSVARLTKADDIETFREKFTDRISALARAHKLLATEQWQAIDLAVLIRQEIDPFVENADQYRLQSDCTVKLPAEFAQSISLIIHELATNATKYGAFGTNGHLDVNWSVVDDHVRFVWKETLGSSRDKDQVTVSSGFGSSLLERIASGQLGGTVEQKLENDGFRFSMRFPVDRATNVKPVKLKKARPLGKPRVLIVEDEAILSMDLESMITELGLDIFGAYASVPQCLEALKDDTPDAALLDANLGSHSSVPVAEFLHERGVPFAFITGYDELSDISPALKSVPVLTKPLTEGGLKRFLNSALPREEVSA